MSAPITGIYVHWPWCARICPYCDFNVYPSRQAEPEPLIGAICQEITHWRQHLGPRRIGSVFFGGGTPSLALSSGLAHILEHIATLFTLGDEAEISLEANPEDYRRFDEFAAIGVNRFSLGVQSLDEAQLRFLGRSHSALTARTAIKAAQKTAQTTSIDLIYALPEQSIANWTGQLKEALAMAPEHISLYMLEIGARTAFGRRAARGVLIPPPDEQVAALYETTQSLTQNAKMPAYEISNHARSKQYQCQHNLLYWRSGDWLGLGPGAHGRITDNGSRYASKTTAKPEDYIANASTSPQMHSLTSKQADQEQLIMGLRLIEGISIKRLDSDTKTLVEQGLVQLDKDRLFLTPAGRLLADAIAAQLSAA